MAVGNHKGGAGKTAYTVNTAAAAAKLGYRVLVIDLDPQANASRRLGFQLNRDKPVPTIAEAIKADTLGIGAQAVYPSRWDHELGARIDLIPSRFDLENRISEAGVVGAAFRLRRALKGVDDAYDLVLMDCPPSLGHLTQLALAAADAAIVPVEPEYDSVEGAVRMRDFIADRAGDLGVPGLPILGYVVSRVRATVGAHAFQLSGLGELFGERQVWTPHVPERAPIKDAADAAIPLRALGRSNANEMAALYEQLAERLLAELKQLKKVTS